jgi:hypothetical protein
MSSYDLVIASAKAFHGNTYGDLLREIADFADEQEHRVILGVNIEFNSEESDNKLTAYVMYEN